MSDTAHLPPQPAARVTRQVAGIALTPMGRGREAWLWLLALGLVGLFALSLWRLFDRGTGIWGLDRLNVWGFDIASYVWWVGLGNAGAILSALLLLIGHDWRTSLNRLAEGMTLASAAVAGLFPLLHLGRPEFVYWVFPIRVEGLDMWPQFRSPLAWDAYAVLTYLGVVGTFGYVGLIPDLATLRDRAWRRVWARAYGVLALGWRGSARHWARWQAAYRLIAALVLPYVVLIHAGVALLFAGGPIPGWHSTVFPVLFMLGGTLAGFGVMAVLAVLLRASLGLENLITPRHLESLARIALALSLAYLYGYLVEAWTILYAGDPAELAVLRERLAGPEAWVTWAAWGGSVGAAQLFWIGPLRRNPLPVGLIGLSIAVSIYAAHEQLIVTALATSHFPAMQAEYAPTVWEWGLLAGSFGLFVLLMLLFLRTLPVIPMAETGAVLQGGGRAP